MQTIEKRKSDLVILEKHQLVDVLDNWDLNDLSTDERRILIRSQCYYDIEYFAQHITTRWTSDKKSELRYATPEFHKELWALVGGGKDVVCIVPRGFGKTTAVSKIWVLWALLFQVEPSIMLVMSKGLGEEVVGDIRRELETNELIRWIWGDIVPVSNKDEKVNEKWRQRQLQLLNGTEVKTVTKGEPIRGNRPTKIIIDDPQENKDVKNPVMADEFYNWVFTSVYASLNADGGSMAVLGTLISENCFVNKLKVEAREKQFKLVEFPAIKNFKEDGFDGESLWPDRWPKEKLEHLFYKLGPEQFMQELMNKPLILNGSPVYSESLLNKLIIRKPLYVQNDVQFYVANLAEYDVFFGIDLASGSQRGDYTTIIGRDQNYKLLFQYQKRVSQEWFAIHIVDWLVKLCRQVFLMPERNYGWGFISQARKFDWFERVYRSESVDKLVEVPTTSVGWNTNESTKLILIGDQKVAMDSVPYEVSAELFYELSKFYHDDASGSMMAISPNHDDLVMADTLAAQAIKRGLLYMKKPEQKQELTKIQKFEKQLFKPKKQDDNI